MAQVVLTVPAISCGHCAAPVRDALAPVPGVRTVDVAIATTQATIENDDSQADIQRFTAALPEEDDQVALVEPVA